MRNSKYLSPPLSLCMLLWSLYTTSGVRGNEEGFRLNHSSSNARSPAAWKLQTRWVGPGRSRVEAGLQNHPGAAGAEVAVLGRHAVDHVEDDRHDGHYSDVEARPVTCPDTT